MLAPGQWTDDTSMALCLAESLVRKAGFDPVDQLERYVRWYRTGYLSSTGRFFDIGGTTRSALQRFERTHKPYPGPGEPYTAGNGSLMRLAPVPMFYARTPEQAIELCAASSRTTHGNILAVDACRYFGALLVAALIGQPKEVLLAPLGEWHFLGTGAVQQLSSLHPAILEVAGGAYRHKTVHQVKGSGYVVAALEAALWAFDQASTYAEAVLLAANLGDDADTTAAIVGQLAGAYYGEEAIPPGWHSKLAMHDLIVEYADRLLVLAQTQSA